MKILFDFDGTVTNVETIPFIASRLNSKHSDLIFKLTQDSCLDADSYQANLRKRIGMLSDVAIGEFVSNLSSDILRPSVCDFIKNHKDICEIVSCNLDCWCLQFTSFLEITCHFSSAVVLDGHVAGVSSVLDKVAVVKKYQSLGYSVIFVGDSANDFNAMRVADDAVYFDNGSNPLLIPDKDFFSAISEDDIIKTLDNLIIKYQS